MRVRRTIALTTWAFGLCGCGEAEAPPVPAPVEVVAADPLHHLTRTEYLNTIRDFAFAGGSPAAATEAWRIPFDRVTRGYDTMATSVTPAHVEGWYAVADVTAAAIARPWANRAALWPCLGEAAPDLDCARAAIDAIGLKVLRRPVRDEERALYLELFTAGLEESAAEATELVLLAMLQSPAFLYRIEGDAAPEAAGALTLTSYEQVTRLSYALWGSTPSAALLARAGQQDHLSPDELLALGAEMMSDARFRPQLVRFFDQWLDLPYIPEFRYPPGFVELYHLDGLTAAMIDEVRRYLLRQVLDRRGTWADVLTTPEAYLRHTGVAAMYGKVLSDGGEDGWMEIADGTRSGLLTLPGMLKGASEFSSPVRRGVLVLRRLLCDPIEPPPPTSQPDDALALPPASEDLTNRERWALKTSPPACAACHTRINAYGFALERYDTLGRYRTKENTLGVLWNGAGKDLPIDDSAEALLDGELSTIHGAAELSAALAQSRTVQRCLAVQWLRFTRGRKEAPEDEPAIELMARAIAERPLVEGLWALFATNLMQVRRGPEEEAK